MVVWWSTQAIPIGATSLLPLLLFPAMGVLGLRDVATNYANPIIYLFLGGFVIGLAIEKWNIHRRVALLILRVSGEKPWQVVAGFMGATAILSMWISNTASAVMMLPIGLSVVGLLENRFPDKSTRGRFAISLLLGLAFAANVGGMCTLIGTPPNLVLAGIVHTQLGMELSFATWFLFALPLGALIFGAILLINTGIVFRIPAMRMVGVKEMVNERIKALGKLSSGEKRVAVIFSLTAFLWIVRAPLSKISFFSFLSDTWIALAGALALFIVTDNQKKRLMTWPDMNRMPWDILLLFGGGLSIAMALSETGWVTLLGDAIQTFRGMSWIVVVLIITAIAVFLTELMSNVALVSALLPVVIGIAPGLGGEALELAIPLTLGASCAFMLPIATPPNAIVFSGSYIRVGDMMRAGFWLNLVSILLIVAYCYWMVPLFF